MSTQWISVAEYARKMKKNSPQVIYEWLAKGKLKEGEDWKKVEIVKTKILVRYEEGNTGETVTEGIE